MAEILIRVKDKGPRVEQSKRGQVICIQPDGWQWSEIELTNPEWRIIRVPLLQTHIDTLLSQPVEYWETGGLVAVPRRKYKVNLDRLANVSLFDPTAPRGDIIELTRKSLVDVIELREELIS